MACDIFISSIALRVFGTLAQFIEMLKQPLDSFAVALCINTYDSKPEKLMICWGTYKSIVFEDGWRTHI